MKIKLLGRSINILYYYLEKVTNQMNSKPENQKCLLTLDQISELLEQRKLPLKLNGDWSYTDSITCVNLTFHFDERCNLTKIEFEENGIKCVINDVNALCDLTKVLTIIETKTKKSIHYGKLWSGENFPEVHLPNKNQKKIQEDHSEKKNFKKSPEGNTQKKFQEDHPQKKKPEGNTQNAPDQTNIQLQVIQMMTQMMTQMAQQNVPQTNGVYLGNNQKECKFGNDCTKLRNGTCTFAHPQKKVAVQKKVMCKFGNECTKRRDGTCTFSHS